MVILCFGRNDFTGSIPTSLSNLTELQVLDLHDNWLTGYVPHTLGRLQALQRADLGTNMLEADNRITKVLTIRLEKVADKLILRNQTAFMKNRDIMNGIMALHEILHETKRKKGSWHHS